MLHVGLPVRVGGLMVNQGDLLHGDVNGVTNIPTEIVDEIVEIADEFVASEDIMLNYVKSDEPKTVARFSELREEFQVVVGKLRERVSRS